MTNSPMEGAVDTADDAFLFDRERIEQIASVEAVKKGLGCFNENRVLEVERVDTRLWARVEEDENADFPYLVIGSSGEDGHLHFSCECGPDEEARCHHLSADYFASDGSFKARMPDDFFRFVELADNRGDSHIGEDAVDWANHQAQTVLRRHLVEKQRRRP